MKAEDVRIGNLVYYHIVDKLNEPEEWDAENIVDCFDIAQMVENPESNEYKPIPLTEEWLLKFGFKNSKSQDKFFVIDNNMGVSTANNEFIFIMGNFVCQLVLIKLQFVHHLQNLYFALSGKELTL